MERQITEIYVLLLRFDNRKPHVQRVLACHRPVAFFPSAGYGRDEGAGLALPALAREREHMRTEMPKMAVP
jgi:hypothetical protein